ncbi:acyl-CoA desaturase [Prosthecobacter sp.]|uniref:acyl-CoA desaturase n=1 Tax=Prosthecobacter sp. TaxID=1965333 RepID=UPI0037850541
MLRQWHDSDYRPPGWKGDEHLPDGIDWRRCLPFIVLHAGCLAVFWVGFSWAALVAALLLYAVRMFAITAFYHRYFSHRSFRTSRWMQFLFAVLGNTSCQRGALWWASVHRHHHQHSDETPDAHSPRMRGFIWSHIGWLTSPKNFPTDYSRIRDLERFPELVFLNRHDQMVPLLYGALLWLAGWLLERHAPGLGTNGPQMFVWGFFISTTALLHATFFINSLAHVFGSRRFKTEDDSRNSLLLALLTLGEGWHNNHHRYSGSARQGFFWWEIDVSYYALKMLSWMGLIWDLKEVPPSVYREAEQLKQSQGA